MLIALYICLFFMSNVVPTWALLTLRLSYHIISPERFIVTYLWVNFQLHYSSDGLYIGFHSQSLKIPILIANEIFHMAFLHAKVTQPLLCFWDNLVFFISPPGIFMSSPIGFHVSPVEKLLAGLTPENFKKVLHFSRWIKQSPSEYWDRVFYTLKITVKVCNKICFFYRFLK